MHPLEHVPVRLDAAAGGDHHDEQAAEERGGAADLPARHPPGRDQVAGRDESHRGEHPWPGLRLPDQLPEVERWKVHITTVARRPAMVPAARRHHGQGARIVPIR